MSIEVTPEGVLKIIQGDTGSMIIDGIPTDKNYEIYLAIRRKDRSLVLPEMKQDSNFNDLVIFEITKQMSDLLHVPQGVSCQLYYWGVKMCDPETGYEDTMNVGECRCNGGYFGKWNRLYVYPKIVEGIVDV